MQIYSHFIFSFCLHNIINLKPSKENVLLSCWLLMKNYRILTLVLPSLFQTPEYSRSSCISIPSKAVALKLLADTCESIATNQNKFQLNQVKPTRVIDDRLMARPSCQAKVFNKKFRSQSFPMKFSPETVQTLSSQ